MVAPILVLGGAGYIGSHCCKALSEAGYLPVAFDNLSSGHRWAAQWGPLEIGELSDAARLDDVFRRYRPAAVMHFASFIEAGESVIDPARFYANNVVNMLGVLQAMRRAGVDRIVFSSTAAVYGTPQILPIPEGHALAPINPYGKTKSMCEAMLRDFAHAYRIKSVSLRYFNAAGADPDARIGEAHDPETHLIPLVLEAAAGLRPSIAVFGDGYKTADGTCIRDYVHVADLAAAHLLALERLERAEGAQAFNLGNGHGHSVREVIATAERVTGRTIPVRIEPPRPGDPASLVADSARARRELRWRPRYEDLHSQVSHAWRWFLRYRVVGARKDATQFTVRPIPSVGRENGTTVKPKPVPAS